MDLYPRRMRWVEIYLMRSDLDIVTDVLHDSRILQLNNDSSGVRAPPVSDLLEVKNGIGRIIELLSPMEPKKKGFLTPYLNEDTARLTVKPSGVLGAALAWLGGTEMKVSPLRKELDSLSNDLDYLKEMKARLIPLSGLDVNIFAISSLKQIRIRIGTTRNFRQLEKAVTEVNGELEGSLINRRERLHSVRVVYSRSVEREMEMVLRGRLFSEINLDVPRLKNFLRRRAGSIDALSYPILRLIRELERMEGRIQHRITELQKSGSMLALKILPEARSWREAVEIELDKMTAKATFPGTVFTHCIRGWIESDRIRELEKMIALATSRRFHIDNRAPENGEIEENLVPTKLKNGRFASLFETLTLTFSTPRYNEIDPSLWISFPFLLFFGLMLGDAGYGLLILLPSIYIFRKGKGSRVLRSMGAMGILMGLSTVIAGVWMGSFFGDLIPRLIFGNPDRPLYSLSLFGYGIPYETLKDPMLLFKVSLWMGLAQLNLGFFLLGYDRLGKKDIWGFIKGSFSWLLIQTGAVIFIGSLLIGWWKLNDILTITGAATFIIGSALLFFESGPMFLFDIEGFLGDWISYTRILALGLSTFGLAMAFNIVGEMLVDISKILVPIVIVLLVFLHIFNLLLQTLGAAVHSVRLQFVEFFGRFYEGGGKIFHPFGRERLFTSGIEDQLRGGVK